SNGRRTYEPRTECIDCSGLRHWRSTRHAGARSTARCRFSCGDAGADRGRVDDRVGNVAVGGRWRGRSVQLHPTPASVRGGPAGPVAMRQDDLALFKETAAGRVRPRLSGNIARFELTLDGFFMHGGVVAGVPDVPVAVRGAGQTHDARTDGDGRFTLVGLEPG